ncbi:MAG: hypothetical protein ACR2IA_01140 [Pyrinomonadaceae bacterium]
MGKVQPIRKDEEYAKQPINIGDRAIDNLQFIRETMERSTVFTSVPGYGGIFMGATAVAAAVIANFQPTIREWLIVWLVEAFLAVGIGFFAMWQKSKITKNSLLSAPAKKFAMSFFPPILCAIFITFGLWRFGHFEVMIPVWILLYGAAIICGGANSVRVVPIAGWCFIAVGAVAFFLPTGFGNAMMGLSFGVLHVVFGAIIAWKHGG